MAVAALLVAGCQKEEMQSANNSAQLEVMGYCSPQSRTAFGEPDSSTIPFGWTKGDRIWLGEQQSAPIEEDGSVARFVEQLTELPSKTVAYRLYIRTYHFSDSSAEPAAPRGEGLYVATHRDHLSAALLRPFVAYLCYEARRNGTPFLPTREQILHYGFARKDVVALEPQLAACNEALARELATDDEHK